MAGTSVGAAVPVEAIAADAADVDANARFPTESVDALRDAGLFGLLVPADNGGDGGGIPDAAAAVEQVAAACASTGMIYTMHLAATQTLVAGRDSSARIGEELSMIAAGEHLATLAYSERGSRSHFWAPVSRLQSTPSGTMVDADKSWVTSAGHADAYVVSVGVDVPGDPLASDLYLLGGDEAGFQVGGDFNGLGLRGNASRPMTLREVALADDARLGERGAGFGLMLTATLPTFVICSAACCVGVAGAALDAAAGHAANARLEHLGMTLAELPVVRARLAAA